MKTIIISCCTLFCLILFGWTTNLPEKHAFSYLDGFGNKITIENTLKFQTVLDTNFVIHNLTSKHFDSTICKSENPKCSLTISDIKKIKHKKDIDLYELRVFSIPHAQDIGTILKMTGYMHFQMTVKKVNGCKKMISVFYTSAEI